MASSSSVSLPNVKINKIVARGGSIGAEIAESVKAAGRMAVAKRENENVAKIIS